MFGNAADVRDELVNVLGPNTIIREQVRLRCQLGPRRATSRISPRNVHGRLGG